MNSVYTAICIVGAGLTTVLFGSCSSIIVPETAAALSPGSHNTAAVDAKGVHHRGVDQRGNPPWLVDVAKGVAPAYPYQERAKHHQGRGIMHLTLDLRNGTVVDAKVLRSTGFATLDRCALDAFRRWKWKPGKWKEIDLPVTFEIANPAGPWPRGSILLPTQ
jgi:TonB family protein